jgi:hypothetical protein
MRILLFMLLKPYWRKTAKRVTRPPLQMQMQWLATKSLRDQNLASPFTGKR